MLLPTQHTDDQKHLGINFNLSRAAAFDRFFLHLLAYDTAIPRAYVSKGIYFEEYLRYYGHFTLSL